MADRFLAPVYSRSEVEFIAGSGAYLYDGTGAEYLDFLSGIAVTSFGHQHPSITKAAADRLGGIWHTSNLFAASGQEMVASRLAVATGLQSVFFSNSGTEANEAAIKFARKYGGGERYEIISMLGGFHGRSMGSLSATGQYKVREGFYPVLPGFSFVPFNDAAALRAAVNWKTVGILLEVIQGENGIIGITPEFADAINNIAEEHGLLVIIDEVQTGAGRTGQLFAHQAFGLQPDMVTFAKGIANGLPLGGVICSGRVTASLTPGCHGSTFGGNPVTVAAANAVLDELTPACLTEIRRLGRILHQALLAEGSGIIARVRQFGLMLGVQLVPGADVKEFSRRLLQLRVVTAPAGNNTLRLLPPFVITEKEIEGFMEAFRTAAASFHPSTTMKGPAYAR